MLSPVDCHSPEPCGLCETTGERSPTISSGFLWMDVSSRKGSIVCVDIEAMIADTNGVVRRVRTMLLS